MASLGIHRPACTTTDYARSLISAAASGLVGLELIFAFQDARCELVELIVYQFGAAIELS